MALVDMHADLPTVAADVALKIITDAIAGREQEVLLYRINIANYTAMAAAGGYPEAQPSELLGRIAAETVQLDRSLALLAALKALLPAGTVLAPSVPAAG
jgi:hypothetical protein